MTFLIMGLLLGVLFLTSCQKDRRHGNDWQRGDWDGGAFDHGQFADMTVEEREEMRGRRGFRGDMTEEERAKFRDERGEPQGFLNITGEEHQALREERLQEMEGGQE